MFGWNREQKLFLCLTACMVVFSAIQAGAAAPIDDDIRITPVVRAVTAASPAVVNITTTTETRAAVSPFQGMFPREFFGHAFDQMRPEKRMSLGSGVIIDGKKGLVLTNAHVISEGGYITAKLLDGREFTAELVASEPDFDLAVLHLEKANDLPQLEMGDSAGLLMGETVIAIGNPYGYSNTVTTGVVSAVKRSLETKGGMYTDLIQTDAAINPGNSGGPLLDIHGRLIGINTAIQAGAEGIGFAIPIDKAKRVVAELMGTGKVSPVWLGITGQSLDGAMASYFGLASMNGLLVTDVQKDTEADGVGLVPGDVVLSVGGIPITDKEHFVSVLRNATAGETLSVRVHRKGTQFDVKVRPRPFTANDATRIVSVRWGITALPAKLGKGILVSAVEADSAAGKIGLRSGDRIMRIGSTTLSGMDDFVKAALLYRMQNSLMCIVQRDGHLYRVRFQV